MTLFLNRLTFLKGYVSNEISMYIYWLSYKNRA